MKALETIHFQAYHDLLTRLPNRELFLDRLKLSIAQADRNKTKVAVLYLDMDGFKFINDTLGHIIGDNLLQSIAMRLTNLLRDTDTVSRIGGDEFNILLPEVADQNEAGLVAEKIINCFSKPLAIDNQDIVISFSIGISTYPVDAKNSLDLIKNADMAMYHIKARGKNGYEYFSENMQSIYQHRHNLEQDIHRALKEKQFEAYCQPQYKIPENEIYGLESLIRWNHPDRGFISPEDFIPIAEEIGMISDIGLFMLESGCKQLKKWIDDGFRPVKLSINVSAYQLIETDFDKTVCSIVRRYALPENLLMLEITETALLQDMEHVIQKLKNISKCGIGISIDDFGIGYSSLSYLQALPVDMIKIDRSFLESEKQDKQNCILKGIVALAKELQLGIVVEGVENKQQLSYVDEVGCDIIQGFYFSRPVPENEITPKLLKLV